jgi:LysM repeat protein
VPAVVLAFPRPASLEAEAAQSPDSVTVAAPAIDGPRDDAPLDVASMSTAVVVGAPVDGLRALVDAPRTLVDAPRGPVACPSSRPTRPVRNVDGPDPRKLRLTARGRRLRALICACALVVAGWITVSAIHSAVSSPVIPPSAPAVVQVHQGDSLWSIAARVAPQQDPRRVVDALRSANHLDSNTVRAGQQLHVPR